MEDAQETLTGVLAKEMCAPLKQDASVKIMLIFVATTPFGPTDLATDILIMNCMPLDLNAQPTNSIASSLGIL